MARKKKEKFKREVVIRRGIDKDGNEFEFEAATCITCGVVLHSFINQCPTCRQEGRMTKQEAKFKGDGMGLVEYNRLNEERIAKGLTPLTFKEYNPITDFLLTRITFGLWRIWMRRREKYTEMTPEQAREYMQQRERRQNPPTFVFDDHEDGYEKSNYRNRSPFTEETTSFQRPTSRYSADYDDEEVEDDNFSGTGIPHRFSHSNQLRNKPTRHFDEGNQRNVDRSYSNDRFRYDDEDEDDDYFRR